MTLGLSRRRFLGALLAATAGGRSLHARGAAQGWVDRRTYGPFACVSAFPMGSLDAVFEELSGLEQELHRTLAVPPARQSVDVFLLADEESQRLGGVRNLDAKVCRLQPIQVH